MSFFACLPPSSYLQSCLPVASLSCSTKFRFNSLHIAQGGSHLCSSSAFQLLMAFLHHVTLVSSPPAVVCSAHFYHCVLLTIYSFPPARPGAHHHLTVVTPHTLWHFHADVNVLSFFLCSSRTDRHMLTKHYLCFSLFPRCWECSGDPWKSSPCPQDPTVCHWEIITVEPVACSTYEHQCHRSSV